MPDISMCTNSTCKLNTKCYRYTAIPNSYQWYSEFKSNEENDCFMSNKGRKNREDDDGI